MFATKTILLHHHLHEIIEMYAPNLSNLTVYVDIYHLLLNVCHQFLNHHVSEL